MFMEEPIERAYLLSSGYALSLAELIAIAALAVEGAFKGRGFYLLPKPRPRPHRVEFNLMDKLLLILCGMAS
jgi:hypothetical protein